MDNFNFWQKLLFIVSLIIIIFGVSLAFFNQTSFFDFLFNNQINPSFWEGGKPSADILRFQQFIYGVLGCTVAGWGIVFAFMFHYALQKKELWVWNCIVVALTVWYMTDSAISWYFKVYFNVIFNTALFAAIIPLMFLIKKYFKKY